VSTTIASRDHETRQCHRPELEAFHTRKLVLEHRADGARLVSDEVLPRIVGRPARLLARLPARRRPRKG
jgi:putative ATP-binding cassette transporter